MHRGPQTPRGTKIIRAFQLKVMGASRTYFTWFNSPRIELSSTCTDSVTVRISIDYEP